MSMSCGEALQWGVRYLQQCHIDSARLDAEVLLAHCFGCERSALYRDRERRLTPEEWRGFADLIARRGAHAPLAYLTGMREFWSLSLAVRPGVLIPRPETEWVVETALQYVPLFAQRGGRCRVLDIGTGSGNIAIAIAASQADVVVVATDLSSEALVVAQSNARACRVAERVTFVQGDLFGPFNPRVTHFDLLLSNPPYIAAGEITTLPKTVREYEPHLALNGGDDGLSLYRRLIAEGPQYLSEAGVAIVEVGYQQAGAVSQLLMQSQQWQVLEVVKDYSGIERVVVAQQRSRGAARHGLHRDRRWRPT